MSHDSSAQVPRSDQSTLREPKPTQPLDANNVMHSRHNSYADQIPIAFRTTRLGRRPSHSP
jgi:hypothetical protein